MVLVLARDAAWVAASRETLPATSKPCGAATSERARAREEAEVEAGAEAAADEGAVAAVAVGANRLHQISTSASTSASILCRAS